MADKFHNKFRIPSARAQWWDYGQNAAYFVTICTQNHDHFFGKITEMKMQLSQIGEFAQRFWLEIPQHFSYVKLDAFVIMPNHLHGIIVIDKTAMEPPAIISDKTTPTGGFSGNKNPMLNDNLPRIIRWYKGRTSFESNKTDPCFAWQPRYYDHIIRNEKSYQAISAYIINNPAKWGFDKFNIE